MSVDHVITKRAADGTLTIAELREFLAEFDKAATEAERTALKNGHGIKPKARVSFGGGIKSVTVTIPGGEAER
jgi:hypothetical protein